MSLSDSIFQLIVQTSVNMPSDIRKLIDQAYQNEEEGSLSKRALETICRNIDVAVVIRICCFLAVDAPAGEQVLEGDHGIRDVQSCVHVDIPSSKGGDC